MTDDPTDWVTVKVPVEDREKANEYRPEGSTYGDCLVAGAERLNDALDSDTRAYLDGENPDLDAVLAEAGIVDPEAIADAVAAELDTTGHKAVPELAAALETVEERTGRIEKLVEEMGAGR